MLIWNTKINETKRLIINKGNQLNSVKLHFKRHVYKSFPDDIIYLFRMAQLNTVHIKIYTRFLFSEVLIHTIVQSCNIRKYKINIKNIKNVKYMT